jgi:hypothetical protein
MSDRSRRDPSFVEERAEAVEHGFRWIVRSRKHFANGDFTTVFSKEENIRESSANVYANAVPLVCHVGHYTKEVVGCQHSTLGKRVE